ncbi:hypothetical protein OVV29_31225, partial [Klebsiella pneumoniae]|nr:hypothetical protein [Klebsiella pneumoniae]
GRNLSAGQLQLLALARARLVDLDILLLDEATVALGPATEGVVQRATLTLAARRTTLIVAHGLAIAEHADRIVATVLFPVAGSRGADGMAFNCHERPYDLDYNSFDSAAG